MAKHVDENRHSKNVVDYMEGASRAGDRKQTHHKVKADIQGCTTVVGQGRGQSMQSVACPNHVA